MKTWAIQLTYHLTDEEDAFAPREWDTSALLEIADAPHIAKQWRFVELIQGATTTAYEDLIEVENNTETIVMEQDPDTQS